MAYSEKKVAILCEDFYGERFLERLIERMKANNLLKNVNVKKIKSLRGKFSKAHARKIAAMLARESYDRIVILVDSEGRSENEVVNYVYSCIDDEDIKAVTKVVVCGYSIEEWICLDMCVDKLDHDCIDYLGRKHRYEKRHLPSYADRIKLQELESKCSGFKAFLSSLDD